MKFGNNILKRFGLVTLLLLSSTWSQANVPNLSAEQLQLFNQLSPAQQQQLMNQQGVAVPSQQVQQPEPLVDTVKPLNEDLNSLEGHEQIEMPFGKIELDTIFPANQLNRATHNLDKLDLTRFGANLFAGQPTTFAPVNDIPVPTDYILGVGDQINIHLFGNKNERMQLVIDRNGQIQLPSVGPVVIAGLTFSHAVTELQKHLERLGVGIESSITLGEMRSFRIFVMGEARQPGSYLVSGMATMTHALYVSGGISDIGSFRNIELRRQGELIAKLDLYDLLIHGNSRDDVRLQPGDTVFIPVQGKQVSVTGAIQRSAIYELKNERSFGDLVRLAGGFSPQAYRDKAKLTRVQSDGFATVLNLNLTQTSVLNQAVQNGDVLAIPGLVDELANVVQLDGEVQRAGVYPWYEGVTLGQLLPNRSAFKRDADLNYLVILRQDLPGQPYEVMTTSWLQAMHTPLLAGDQVFVLSNREASARQAILSQIAAKLEDQATSSAPAPVVSVEGHVRFPGRYPVSVDMDAQNLLMMAGGALPLVDESYVLVRHHDQRSGQLSFSRTDFAQLYTLSLTAGDRLYVFSRQDSNRAELLADDLAKLRAQATLEQPAPIATISGLVRFPGSYPLFEGASLQDLIHAAGGLRHEAVSTQADLIRYRIVDGEERVTQVTNIDLAEVLNSDHKNPFLLNAFDQVIVKQVANWHDSARTVVLEGEVRFPGTYTIEPGETLEQLLVRAGGFTQWAEPRNAVFLRESLRLQEERELRQAADELEKNLLLSVKADAGFYKTDPAAIIQMGNALIERIRQTPALGRLVIGLDPAQPRRYQATLAMELVDGDRLVVPPRPTEVVVTGEVLRSASFIYQTDLSVSDYIELAGGMSRRADKRQVFVVHGDGRIEHYRSGLFSGRNVHLEPGATIVVPMDVERVNPLLTLSSVASILSNFAVTAATLKTLGVFD